MQKKKKKKKKEKKEKENQKRVFRNPHSLFLNTKQKNSL